MFAKLSVFKSQFWLQHDEDLAQVFATDAPRGLVLVFSFQGTDAGDLGRWIYEGLV